MTVATANIPDRKVTLSPISVLWMLVAAAVALMLAKALGVLPDWLDRLPDAWIPPAAAVLDQVFAFVQNDLGLIYV
ncbi:MAG: glycine/betaine ABC transporter permease, partial [Pseudomonadota bacterium]